MLTPSESAHLPPENVTGYVTSTEALKRILDQEDRASAGPLGHISVIGDCPSEAPSGSRKATGKKRKQKPKKRGPRGSKYLEWAQVKQVDHLAHVAKREGYELNRCITVRASKDVSDAEGKREINRQLDRIGEGLKSRGQEWVAVWAYEKDPYLHAHVLIYVAPGNLDLLKNRQKRSGRIVHVRKADAVGPEYITKQRRKLSPEFEARINRSWRKGAHIDGPRVGYSKAARALLNRFPLQQIREAVFERPEESPLPPEPPRPAAQMGLPLDWVPSRPFSDAGLMGQFIQVFGYTQREAAKQLGYRDRSHVANIMRGHDGMSPTRRKYLEYRLETGLIA